MLVFSVRAGAMTEVNILLARLEVGLVSIKDGSALKGEPVTVSCQDVDIAGKKVESTKCEKTYNLTDERGIATFNLGAGIYIITTYGGLAVYDVTLRPGETRREIYKTSKQ